MEIRHLCC